MSSILWRFLHHSFGQVCHSTNFSNPPQVSFAASDSAKNDNNPMQRPGWLLQIILPSCPTFNLLKSSVCIPTRAAWETYCFSFCIDKLHVCNISSLIPTHSYHPVLYDLYCMRKQRRKTFYSFSVYLGRQEETVVGNTLLHVFCILNNKCMAPFGNVEDSSLWTDIARTEV